MDTTTPKPHTPVTTGTGDRRASWGRSSKLGGGTGRLIGVSLLLGTILAALVGVTAYALAAIRGHEDERFPQLMGLLMGASTLPIAALAVWVLLVDRATVRGAITNTEDSVEGRWADAATAGAFRDTLVLVGLGSFAMSMTGWAAPLGLVGAGVCLFMMLSAAVRYLLLRRRG